MKKYKQLILHDLTDTSNITFPPNAKVIDCNGIDKYCIGCFGCWIKTPGMCVIKDNYQLLGAYAGQCEELVLISRCVYGGFSVPVKACMDRFIGYMLPFFTIRTDRQMHHQERYHNTFDLHVYFYGEDISAAEKQTAEKLVERNSLNINASKYTVDFYQSIPELRRQCL